MASLETNRLYWDFSKMWHSGSCSLFDCEPFLFHKRFRASPDCGRAGRTFWSVDEERAADRNRHAMGARMGSLEVRDRSGS